MINIFDALEICLQEIENGADLDAVLSRYPEYAVELRPLLKTAMKAQRVSEPSLSNDAIRRGRARVMQYAAELRESKRASRKHVISGFSRLAISFTFLLLLLMSSIGVLSASASALPGERLYSVKRGWENVRLFFIFDQEARELLKNEFENERLHEVNELLSQSKNVPIQFAGVFMQVNGANYVSGVPVIVPANIQLPPNGEAVIVNGQTNVQGFVEITNLELLPPGSSVPVGNPIQIEIETTPISETEVVYVEIQGTLQSISVSLLIVNSQALYLENAQIIGQLCIGMEIKVIGHYAVDGKFIAKEIIGKDSCDELTKTPAVATVKPTSNEKENNTNSETNSNDNSNDNDNDDDDSDDENDNDDD